MFFRFAIPRERGVSRWVAGVQPYLRMTPDHAFRRREFDF